MLLHTALQYRKKWLQACGGGSTSGSNSTTWQLQLVEHHKAEAKRLAAAANMELEKRHEAYHEWREQEYFCATRLHYPLLKMKLEQLQSSPTKVPSHPCINFPCGEVIFSL